MPRNTKQIKGITVWGQGFMSIEPALGGSWQLKFTRRTASEVEGQGQRVNEGRNKYLDSRGWISLNFTLFWTGSKRQQFSPVQGYVYCILFSTVYQLSYKYQ